MKVGLIVDGDSEAESLPEIFSLLESATNNQLLKPIAVRMTPLAPLGTLAAACGRRIRALEARDIDVIVVLIDRETRSECPGQIASLLEVEIKARYHLKTSLYVVVKDMTFENWLAADPSALSAQTARFKREACARIARQVAPNRADHVDALELIKRAVTRGGYNKREDSCQILRRANVEVMSRNSRSFRRFLRCVGYPSYREQSRLPARLDPGST